MREEDKRFLEEFVKRARKLPNLEAIILFGSLARGEEDRRSDIDLLMIFDHKNPEEYIPNVSKIISKLSPRREVRPVLTNLKDYDPDFLNNVIREGRVLFGKVVLSPKKLGLKAYKIIHYSTKGLDNALKMRLYRSIHGYKIKTMKRGKIYTSEKGGLINQRDVILLGTNVIALPENLAKEFLRFLEVNNITHRTWKVWFSL